MKCGSVAHSMYVHKLFLGDTSFQNHFLDVKLITEFVSIYRQINTSHSICDVLLQVQV